MSTSRELVEIIQTAKKTLGNDTVCMFTLTELHSTHKSDKTDSSGRCTRNSNSLDIPFFKSTTGQRTFHYRAISLWNELPEKNIKCSSSIRIFKHKLRKYLLENHT